MSDPTQKLFAQLTMLDYLQNSAAQRPVKDILTHLHNNTEWGHDQLKNGANDDGLRNVQNWLKAMRTSREFDHQIKHSRNTSNRKQVIYHSTATNSKKLSMEQACLTLLAEKFLDSALPQDFYDAALHDSFTQAREVLEKYEASVSPRKRAVKAYLDRVAIEQRGLQLLQKNPLYDVLAVISKAILDGRCIEVSYNQKQRVLHPYAVVIREPKVYLLAVAEKSMKKIGPKDVKPVQFLCTRMIGAKVSKSANLVPRDFKAEDFISKGKLNVPLQKQLGLSSRPFELTLRIHGSSQGNLLRDLKEFPLCNGQRISKERGTDCHILTAPGMRASHQLVEWIMGRMERVEVLAPVKLRVYVAQRVADMGKIYANDG